jgi:hypothetical protein
MDAIGMKTGGIMRICRLQRIIHKRTDSGTEGTIPAEVGTSSSCVTCGALAGHMMTTLTLKIKECEEWIS